MAIKYWCGLSSSFATTNTRWSTAPPGVVFLGYKSGTTLTVLTVYSGSITPGAVGTGVTNGPVLYSNAFAASGTITAQITPLVGGEVTGGAGRYTTSTTGTIGSSASPVAMYTFLADQPASTLSTSADIATFGSQSVPSPVITNTTSISAFGIAVSPPSSGAYTFSGTGTTAISSVFTLDSSAVWAISGAMTFPGACTITTNGVAIASPVNVAGSSHLPSLGSDFNGTGALTFTLGTITLNNYNWTCSTVSISGAVVKTLAFGTSGTITTTSSSTTVVSCSSSNVQILFTGKPLFVLSGSPTTGARTVSFTNAAFGGSGQTMPGIKVPNGSDSVVLTVPLLSTYSNYGALDFSGFTGSLTFTNQASYMWVYGDFKIPNINITSLPTSGYFLSGPNGSLISITKNNLVNPNLQTNYVQSGDIVCPLLYSSIGAVLTFNNSGTINITNTISNVGNLSANFTGPVTATFDSAIFYNVTGSGTVTINTNTWFHNTSTLPTTATVNVSADNGVLATVANVLYAYTLNILGAGTGGGRTIAGYTTSNNIDYLISPYVGPNLNITTGAGPVMFSLYGVGDYIFNPTFNTINTTGFTGTGISGDVYVSSSLTIPQTLTLGSFAVVSTVGATVTLNAGTSKYSYTCNYNSTTTLSGTCNFTSLTNYGNLNFGSATVNTNYLTLYGPYSPSAGVTYYGAANLGSATVNINSDITVLDKSVSSAGTSTIRLLGTSSATFFGGILNKVEVASTGPHYFNHIGSNTNTPYIENLTNSVSPATINFYGYFNFNTFELSGAVGTPVTITRYATGANPVLGKTTPWVVGANSVDAGNNIGNISYTGSSPDWLVLSYLTVGYSHISTINEFSNASDNIREGGSAVLNDFVGTETATATDTPYITSTKKATVTGASSGSDSLVVDGGFYPKTVQEYSTVRDGDSYYNFDLQQNVFTFGVTAEVPFSSYLLADSSTASETLNSGFEFNTKNNEFASSQDIASAKNFLNLFFSESAQASDSYDATLFFKISANAVSASGVNANLNLQVPLSTVDGTGSPINKISVSTLADIAINKILAYLAGQGVITNALLADLKLTKPIASSAVSLVSIDGKLSLASNLTSSVSVNTTVNAAPIAVGKPLSVYALVTPGSAGDVKLIKPISASAFSTTLFDSLLAVYHAVDLDKFNATTAEIATVTTIFLDVVPQTISADVVSLEIHLITPNAM